MKCQICKENEGTIRHKSKIFDLNGFICEDCQRIYVKGETTERCQHCRKTFNSERLNIIKVYSDSRFHSMVRKKLCNKCLEKYDKPYINLRKSK